MTTPFKPLINPALHRHPDEANIIGRIALAFGEIEFAVCRNAGHALQMLGPILETVYQTRATSARVDFAQNIIATLCADLGIKEEFKECRTMVSRCQKIRNQYAHCNWADDCLIGPESTGLFFADLEKSEFYPAIFHHFMHVDTNLLLQQEAYFAYTLERLEYLNHEIAARQGRIEKNCWPKPPKLLPPPMHNPPAKHPPPFLDKDQKALREAHIRATENGGPRPTPAQRDQEQKKAQKRAKRDEQILRAKEASCAQNHVLALKVSERAGLSLAIYH